MPQDHRSPRSPTVKRRWGAIGLAATLMFTAAACGDDEEDAAAPDTTEATTATSGEPGGGSETTETTGAQACTEPDVIINPTISNTYQQAHVFVADELALWEEHCIGIDYVEVTSAQITSVYIAGEVPYGQLGAGPVGPLLDQEVPVDVHLIPILKYGYVFLVDESIDSWEELRGQPIAITGELGTPHRAIMSLMESEGEDPEDHTFVSLNSFSNIVAAASSGQVMGVAAGLPHSNALRDMGFKELANIAEMDLMNPAGIVGGDPGWVEENRDTAKNFVKAWLEGTYALFADPEMGKEILAERLEMTDPAEIDQSYQAATFVIRQPREQCDNEQYYELFKTNYPDPAAIEDPSVVAPEYDICAELEDEGFFEELEEEYGPLPEKPTESGL